MFLPFEVTIPLLPFPESPIKSSSFASPFNNQHSGLASHLNRSIIWGLYCSWFSCSIPIGSNSTGNPMFMHSRVVGWLTGMEKSLCNFYSLFLLLHLQNKSLMGLSCLLMGRPSKISYKYVSALLSVLPNLKRNQNQKKKVSLPRAKSF